MLVDNPAVERAEAAVEATEDGAAREALYGLLAAFRGLENRYSYLRHQGEPEPEPDPVREPPPTGSLEALAEEWRREAETLRVNGIEAGATMCEKHASELEAAAAAQQFDTVTLEEAETIGGYSYSHLQHLVAEGKIPNAGREGAPRLYLQDVPRKPGYGSGEKASPSTRVELVEDALAR